MWNQTPQYWKKTSGQKYIFNTKLVVSLTDIIPTGILLRNIFLKKYICWQTHRPTFRQLDKHSAVSYWLIFKKCLLLKSLHIVACWGVIASPPPSIVRFIFIYAICKTERNVAISFARNLHYTHAPFLSVRHTPVTRGVGGGLIDVMALLFLSLWEWNDIITGPHVLLACEIYRNIC